MPDHEFKPTNVNSFFHLAIHVHTMALCRLAPAALLAVVAWWQSLLS